MPTVHHHHLSIDDFLKEKILLFKFLQVLCVVLQEQAVVLSTIHHLNTQYGPNSITLISH